MLEVATAINSDLGLCLGLVWNGGVLKQRLRINWRASLVPAAAVIPAPIADDDSAAVKKLVVELCFKRCEGISFIRFTISFCFGF